MAIAFVTQGTTPTGVATGTGTTTVTPAVPGSLVNGNIVVIFVFIKPDTAVPTHPPGWFYLGAFSGGGGTTGLDAGPMRVCAYYRVKRASWSTMPAIAVAAGSACTAQAFQYSNATGFWGVEVAGGADTTAGTTWSVTGDRNPGLAPGDMLLVGTATHTDTITWSAQAVTATGVSVWGTQAERSEPITTQGNDLGGTVSQHPVTTGTASAAPVFTATASTSTATGVSMFIRLREVTAPDLIGTAMDYASGGTFSLISWGDFPTIVANDLALIIWSHSNTTIETTNPPAGFTKYGEITDESVIHSLYYKTCTGSESGTVGFGLDGSSRTTAVMLLIRGYILDAIASVGDTGTDANHTAPNVTPTAANAAVIISNGERLTTGSNQMTAPTGYSVAQVSAAVGSAGSFTGVAYEGTDGHFTAGHASGVAISPGTMVNNVAAGPVAMWSIALVPPPVAGTVEATVVLTATATLTATPDRRDYVDEMEFPVYVAHRGGSDEAAENTMAAYAHAAAIDPSVCLETDCQRNASGTLVLMHDTTVDRTAGNGEVGNVSSYTDTMWNSLTVDDPLSATDQPAAYWSQLRDAYPFRILMPEASHTNVGTDFINAYNLELANHIIVQAFNVTTCTNLANAGYYVCQLYSAGALDLANDAARGMWGVGIPAGHTEMNSSTVTTAHGLGLKVLAYTVDTTTSRDLHLGFGVDGMFTDAPTTIGIYGTPQVDATVALVAGSTLTTTGVEEKPATVALSASSTLTVTAEKIVPVTTAMTAASSLTTSGLRTIIASAALTGVSTLTATAIRQPEAIVALVSGSVLGTTGVRTVLPTVSLTAASTLVATGAITGLVPASVALTASSTLVATAVREPQASVSLVSGSTLTATAVRMPQATVALSAAGTLTTSGTVTPAVFATVGLTAASTLSTGGVRAAEASVALVAASTLTVTAIRFGVPLAVVPLTASSTLVATGLRTVFPTTALVGVSTLSVTGGITGQVTAAVSLTATSTLVATGIRTQAATVALSVVSQLTTGAVVQQLASVALSAVSSLSATAVRIPQATVSLVAGSTLTATGLRTVLPTVALVAGSTLTPTAGVVGQVSATVTLTATATLLTTGVRVQVLSVQLTATSTLGATGTISGLTSATAALTAASTLSVTAVRIPKATVSMTAASLLTVVAVRITGEIPLNTLQDAARTGFLHALSEDLLWLPVTSGT